MGVGARNDHTLSRQLPIAWCAPTLEHTLMNAVRTKSHRVSQRTLASAPQAQNRHRDRHCCADTNIDPGAGISEACNPKFMKSGIGTRTRPRKILNLQICVETLICRVLGPPQNSGLGRYQIYIFASDDLHVCNR